MKSPQKHHMTQTGRFDERKREHGLSGTAFQIRQGKLFYPGYFSNGISGGVFLYARTTQIFT
jgi:hypothetical protein